MPIVEISGLRKRFGANEVLKGIDLAVEPGEVIAIIGKSGSGKSTLLRCINGLEEFQEGSLTVDGQPLLHGNAAAMRALRQHVGMIFQSFNLFPHLSVGRNVMLAPTVGFLVQVIKGTALASVIGFIELTKAGTMITNATFRPFTVYACLALMYFALCFPISAWSKTLENKLHGQH